MERGATVPGEDFVRSVAESCGWSARSVRFLENSGSVNHVARVDTTDGPVAVRYHRDPRRPGEFEAESWCARVATELGLPTPEPLAHGVLEGTPYGVQGWIDGRAPRSTQDVWHTLGEYAAVIAGAELPEAPDALFGRFGRDLPQAWRAHVEYNLNELGESDSLVALGVYAREDGGRITAVLRKTLGSKVFGLSHGDLKPQNLIRDRTGRLVLIDWGCARTGPVPWLDAVVIAGSEPSGTGACGPVEWFLRGCGVRVERDLLDAHRLLESLDLVRWSRDQRPDLLEHHRAVARREVRRVLDAG